MTTLLALIGAKALLYMYLWLISTIVASYMSERKGYGEKPGLATGLCLTILAVVVWLVVPAKADSKWKTIGVFGREKKVQKAA
jgi:disulfide bond formation protein DsbB